MMSHCATPIFGVALPSILRVIAPEIVKKFCNFTSSWVMDPRVITRSILVKF